MRIWLPFVSAGSGADVFTLRLAEALERLGHDVAATPFHRLFQYCPWRLSFAVPPRTPDVIVANTINAFAFRHRRGKLVAIEHHCVFDPAYAVYRSWPQSLYHETLVRRFECASFVAADAVVAPSRYTADTLSRVFRMPRPSVIPNGIDTDYFCPGPLHASRERERPFRLLFVGNLSKRKGIDLLPRIMKRLGPDYELRYTQGLRNRSATLGEITMKPLTRMSLAELRQQYREADALLLPTRYEGFGYAVAEAMACGTPAVVTNCSSLPEIVEDGVTGRLCPIDDVEAFAAAIQRLRENPAELTAMSRKARERSLQLFNLMAWAESFARLFERLLSEKPRNSVEVYR